MATGVRSYMLAFAIAGGLGWWMSQGEIIIGGRADSPNAEPPPAARNAETSQDVFAVRVATFSARDRLSELEIRGRTEADTKVSVRAETGARVQELFVQEGERVAAGAELCRLDLGARRAKMLQAKAKLAHAQLEFEANSKLNVKGFATEMKVATMKAALDAAAAEVEEAEIEVARAVILAPVAGTVQSPMVEVGEVLPLGGICATLINVDPMLFIGQISERDVGKVAVGNGATVETVIGDKVDGTIRYISPAADPETRTFRVEIQFPNTDHTIRDGLTASARIPLPAGKAHLMTSGVLVLNDAGELGVRTVGPQNDVAFQPIKILADAGSDGIWVSGLPLEVTIITVGQDYVTDGQKIQPILQSADAGQ